MSLESAKAFIERMKTDETFVKKIVGCKTAEARLELVKAEGFDFIDKEIKEASSELSPEDLERVSGGGCAWYEVTECFKLGWTFVCD
ncbi:Nif11-like leader peptide family natural product precursor [Elusimicrobiota bacterium]